MTYALFFVEKWLYKYLNELPKHHILPAVLRNSTVQKIRPSTQLA